MTPRLSLNQSTGSFAKAFLFCVSFTVLFIALSFLKNFLPAGSERAAHGIIGCIAAVAVTCLFLRYDKKTFAGTGLKPGPATLPKFIAGATAGILLMGSLSLLAIYLSGSTFTGNTNSDLLSFLLATSPLLPLAFMEELAFRAYPLKLLQDKTGTRSAILFTSLLFALYHLANGWTLQNAIAGAGVWGIVFGSAAVHSKGIAMPTGIHYAANLTTSAFGTDNTGFPLWILKDNPANQTGSSFTVLVPMLCILLTGLVYMEWVSRKEKKNSLRFS